MISGFKVTRWKEDTLRGNKREEGAFLMAQTAKNLPAMQETQVRSLGREDLLEEEMATHSQYSCLGIPWTEEPGWLQSMGSQKSQT